MEAVGRRLFGDDGDSAADGITSEQGALGTAQYLDTLHVHRIHDLSDGTGDIHAIQVNTDSRVYRQGPVGAAHTADHDDGSRITGGDGCGKIEYDVRRKFPEVGKIHHPPLFYIIGRKSSDRDRRVLQTFFTLAGGYYNFLQGAGLGKQFSGCSTKQAGK